MKHFWVENGTIYAPITCVGDEIGRCQNCINRFYCYTGEMPHPTPICESDRKIIAPCPHGKHCFFLVDTLECYLFGKPFHKRFRIINLDMNAAVIFKGDKCQR